jgi:hypothetical protein
MQLPLSVATVLLWSSAGVMSGCARPVENVEPFKVDMTVLSGDQEFSATIYFVEHFALEFADGFAAEPTVTYDLRKMTWRDSSTLTTVNLSECEAWAKANAEKSKASLAKVSDPKTRQLAETMYEPSFKITAENGMLTLANDLLKYEIRSVQTIPEAQRNRLFAYDTLNAYRKAMVVQKLPPFPQLAVTKELKARGMVPNEMVFVVTGINSTLRVTVDLQIKPLSLDEQNRVAAFARPVK